MNALVDPLIATQRRAWRLILYPVVALAIAVPGVLHPLCAEEPTSSPAISQELVDALQKRGDLTLRNATLSGALFTIGELWKINLVVGDEVQGQVNGVFKKAPLHEILEAILLSNGYSYRSVGDSLVVMRLDALGQLNPLFESATIVVEKGDVQEIVTSAKLFSSPRGEIRAINSANSVFVLDFPDRVAMIREFVSRIDAHSNPPVDVVEETIEVQPTAIAYLTPDFIDPVSAKEAIEAVLSKDGKAAIIDIERKIVVVDYPPNLAQARLVLEQIDIPRPQVRIYALIYDLSLEDVEELGFNWDCRIHARNDASGDPQTLFSLDSVMTVPTTANTGGAAMTFANLTRQYDVTGIIRAMQTANDARLLADPNITVRDNEEAVFESITEVPYQQLTQTDMGGQIGTTSFREAGIKLRVKPKIARDNTVLMHIEPEFSRLSGFTPEDNQPIIDTRRATTDVRVANRQTLVIGGLRQRSDTGNFNGIPSFKDLRWLGHLFRFRETNVRESELVVFIMPEIIGYDDLPKPRQMTAAETGLCKLNQVPVAEGCNPRGACASSTDCENDSAECRNGSSISPPGNEPVEFGPSYGPTAPDFGENEPGTPSEGGVTIRQGASSLRLAQLPTKPRRHEVQPARPGDATVLQIPDPAYQLRTAFDGRYRDDGNYGHRGIRSSEPGSNRKNASTPEKQKKGWWQRMLRL